MLLVNEKSLMSFNALECFWESKKMFYISIRNSGIISAYENKSGIKEYIPNQMSFRIWKHKDTSISFMIVRCKQNLVLAVKYSFVKT